MIPPQKIQRALQICCQMLWARGFNAVEAANTLDAEADPIGTRLRGGLPVFEQYRREDVAGEDESELILVSPAVQPVDRLCVFLNLNAKLNVENIQYFICTAQELQVPHFLVIHSHGITPKANQIISDLPNPASLGSTGALGLSTRSDGAHALSENGMQCELFSLDELQYDLTEHVLVPRHRRLTKSQAAVLKSKTKFSILSTGDPVSRYYNFKRGDVIRVERANGFISYRIVR